MFDWLFKDTPAAPKLPLFFHNTLGNKREQFAPRGRTVRMYNCGPTVYDVQHIGNLSAAVFADLLRRVFEYNGYPIKQSINITDFGHLVSDADEGEDKMTKGLRKEGVELTMENMKKLADKFTKNYMEDIEALGVATDKIEFPRASEHVPAMIALIKTLDEKGYAYKTKDGLYFETLLFKNYGVLGGLTDEAQSEEQRGVSASGKHNARDFSLWKLSDDKELGWDSPWGKGFPGWHIECSAMARTVLGEQLDMHTGGIEHIAIHHNNEIAQSEAATGKSPFSRFWLHREHIQIDGKKIAKSEGNTVYMTDVTEKKFHPLALRYWFLTSHYRTPANFTWAALSGAFVAFLRLHRLAYALKNAKTTPLPQAWQKKFHERINDDLDTAGAIAIMWDMLKEKTLSDGEKRAALLDFDKVLHIGLTNPDERITKLMDESEIPAEDEELRRKRDEARKAGDFATADKIRDELATKGYDVRDTDSGTVLVRKAEN